MAGPMLLLGTKNKDLHLPSLNVASLQLKKEVIFPLSLLNLYVLKVCFSRNQKKPHHHLERTVCKILKFPMLEGE